MEPIASSENRSIHLLIGCPSFLISSFWDHSYFLWDHLSNTLPAPKSLSQTVLLREPKLRQTVICWGADSAATFILTTQKVMC